MRLHHSSASANFSEASSFPFQWICRLQRGFIVPVAVQSFSEASSIQCHCTSSLFVGSLAADFPSAKLSHIGLTGVCHGTSITFARRHCAISCLVNSSLDAGKDDASLQWCDQALRSRPLTALQNQSVLNAVIVSACNGTEPTSPAQYNPKSALLASARNVDHICS